jgi:DNA ligase-1
VREALAGLGPLEAKYVVKLALGGGELRIGLKEAQVEEALGRAFGRPLGEVRRANLLRGDVGEVAVLARADALGDARLALFHPIGFMLAQPLATAEEIVAALPSPFAVEAKYDGIRGQAHVGADDAGARRVALFSRTLDDITAGYPEVAAALAALPAGTVLDGELLAVDPARPARALPFKDLQSRLGRKAPDAELLARVPVAFVAYDVLAADGALVLDEPYAARRARVLRLIAGAGGAEATTLRAAPVREARTSADVEAAFDDARAAGEEGIIAKDPASPYTPGRRGKTWIKLKKALATLDVVIVGAEWGHGRRRAVLSDYTFAVRRSADDPTLLTVGKAYNGLTDVEIAALTERLRALTEQRFGRYHAVRPEVVLEVTFDVVQASARHKAGYALRFPRIVRIRDDKPAAEIDTLARVRELAGE